MYTILLHFLIIFVFTNSTPVLSHTLNFSPEGKFKILQLTDLHYGEGSYTDQNTQRLQAELIERVQPDVVVVTGDVVSGYAYHGQPNFFEDAWEKFSQPFIDNDIYYAFTIGNHDAQGDVEPKTIYELEKKNKFSLCALSQEGSFDHFNYYLPVYSGLQKGNVSSFLWVFDSHSVGCSQESNSWGCVGDPEIEWYHKNSQELKKKYGSNVHHLGFFHIPVPEYMDLYNDYEFYGHRNEDASCPLINTGFFDALKKNGDIQAIFVGHDHLNDYGGYIDNIELVYGRRMGYAGYGHLFGFQRGARVIELTEKLDKNGELIVERNHYVIVEHEKQEDLSRQKELHRRKGPRQVVCVAGNNSETYFSALLWILIGGVVIYGMGILNNKMIKQYKKKRNLVLTPVKVKKELANEHDDELTHDDEDWAI